MAEDLPHVHRYDAELHWTGSTGEGYDAYDRSHRVRCPPVDELLTLSSDPAFHGDPGELDPERLLVAAAASCQLLAFLAVAARARIDVVAYVDHAAGEMPERPRGTFIERIVLRPTITVRGHPAEERLRKLVDLAHRECYIASSLRSEVLVEPEIVYVGEA
jgi:organic hydroperoxide reductase OsmC/OhrA